MSSKDPVKTGKKVLEEEKKAIENLIDALDKNFKKAVEVIVAAEGKVIVTGMGKSGHVGQKIAATLASTGTPAFFLHPAEAIHGDLGMISKGDVILAISNSGETPELLAIIPTIKRWGHKIIAITNNPESTLAKESHIHLFLNVKREACPHNLAPTSSSTATLALGDALAIALLEMRGFTPEDFAQFHPGGSLGKRLMKVSEIMHTGEKLPLVKPETPLKETVLIMSEKGFGCALIIEEENLIGIITDGDLRRFIKKGGSIDTGKTDEAMTKNPKTVSKDMLVVEALEIMERYNITVLPVVKDKKPIGLVHMHDILKSGVI
ncbi:KpsF/GutQ family sugar-phosphate isomerase [Persephonella atlantica]|uniref:KpsF/GutQ family sugar-phosphate isomerase n=1 Tax=Persephonella atlantica TaxID=2699429 RepID=A0ABS1GK63_9AQUI|nr:KpsF/GutQ family sugar-phosphate isomerase [Persephonella atlantica]MBK3333322.1 KpsF/GutQ family sugar-phosphate isomerase [Persephonella atlantica]